MRKVLVGAALAALLLLSGTALAQGDMGGEPALAGTTWQWAEFQGGDGSLTTVPAPENYTILFNEDGTLNVRADCNQVQGDYTNDNGSIDITLTVSTRAMCPPDSLDETYKTYLGDVAGFVINGGELFLNLMADAGTLRFVAANSVTLVGPTWQWVGFQGMDDSAFEVDGPDRYTIVFNDDGTVNVQADCNVVNGSYTGENGALDIELTTSTMALCPPDSLDTQFSRDLGDVASYVIEDGTLYLNLMMDAGNMIFEQAETLELVGQTWQWTEFQGQDGSVVTVAVPANYTLTFNPDGTVNNKSDCNVGSGTYTADGESLSVALMTSTRAACPEGTQADVFEQYLAQVVSYVIADGKLYLNLMMDGGNMVFEPAGPELVGTTWQWVAFQNPMAETAIDSPESYTVTLGADGSASVKADCNVLLGSYSLSTSQLSIELGVSTLAQCPPGSLSNEFQLYIGDVASYVIEDGKLYLNLMMDAGALIMEPADATK